MFVFRGDFFAFFWIACQDCGNPSSSRLLLAAAVTKEEAESGDLADLPIVAIRGRSLAFEEEALPEGAELRFGSTRFRHPTEISKASQIADHYLLTTSGRRFTLTDTMTGRRTHIEKR